MIIYEQICAHILDLLIKKIILRLTALAIQLSRNYVKALATRT